MHFCLSFRSFTSSHFRLSPHWRILQVVSIEFIFFPGLGVGWNRYRSSRMHERLYSEIVRDIDLPVMPIATLLTCASGVSPSLRRHCHSLHAR